MSAPTAIAQVVPRLQPCDSLSNDALAVGAQLRQFAPVTLHCIGPVHPGLAHLVHGPVPGASPRLLIHLDPDARRPGDRGLLADAPLPDWAGRAGSVVVRVHSGPAHDRARAAHPSAILVRSDLALAVSTHVAQAVIAAGAPHVAVAPPLLPLDELFAAGDAREHESAQRVGCELLAVGPFRAGSRVTDAVAVDHLLRTHVDAAFRLRLVGEVLDDAVSRSVSLLSDELRLGSPWLGQLGHPQYVRAVAGAGVLVHLAEETSFGSALVEAMAAGTPVVVRSAGAAAETVGAGGVVLRAHADLTVVVEAVRALRTDTRFRRQVVAAGRLRAAELSPAAAAVSLLRALREVGW